MSWETFITAWKHLSHLRERDKLRSRLCGIARNRINNFPRREGRELIRRAEAPEDAPEAHSPEPLPVECTISKEEQEILWRSLEKIRRFIASGWFCFTGSIHPRKPWAGQFVNADGKCRGGQGVGGGGASVRATGLGLAN